MRLVIPFLRSKKSKTTLSLLKKRRVYAELVRHLCNNPKCFNAEHLCEGNHSDNVLDRRGDLYKISKYYQDTGRWKPNQGWNGKKVSYSVYDWEKKLNLKQRYPDVCSNRLYKLRKKQNKD